MPQRHLPTHPQVSHGKKNRPKIDPPPKKKTKIEVSSKPLCRKVKTLQHYKTRFFFFCFLLCFVDRCCPNNKTKQNNKTNKQQLSKTRASNHNKTTIMRPRIQANEKSKHTPKNDNNTKPNEEKHYRTTGSVVFWGVVLSLVVAAQTTKQQNNKTMN